MGLLPTFKLFEIKTFTSKTKWLLKSYVNTSQISGSYMSTRPISFHASEKMHTNLFNLRKVAPATFHKINESSLKTLLTSTEHYNVFEVISQRMRNGLFLDSKSGCYLMQNFMKNGDNLAAILIAHQLLKHKQTDENVSAFAAKSCYNFVQYFLQHPDLFHIEEMPTEKLRIKYLSNASPNTNLRVQIGNIISNISDKLPTHLNGNMKVISYAICKRNDDFIKTVNEIGTMFFDDTISVCRLIFEVDNKNTDPIFEFLLNVPSSKILNGKLSDEIDEYSNNFIKKNFPKNAEINLDSTCVITRENNDEDLSNKIDGNRLTNLLDDLKKNANNIWFFEMEDKVELKIYQKRVHYPIRWFGKKKTPKGIEDTYIPPEVQSRML